MYFYFFRKWKRWNYYFITMWNWCRKWKQLSPEGLKKWNRSLWNIKFIKLVNDICFKHYALNSLKLSNLYKPYEHSVTVTNQRQREVKKKILFLMIWWPRDFFANKEPYCYGQSLLNQHISVCQQLTVFKRLRRNILECVYNSISLQTILL